MVCDVTLFLPYWTRKIITLRLTDSTKLSNIHNTSFVNSKIKHGYKGNVNIVIIEVQLLLINVFSFEKKFLIRQKYCSGAYQLAL